MATTVSLFASLMILACTTTNETLENSTNVADFPFIATISDDIGFICGGSILRKQYPSLILTAAHCFDHLPDKVDNYKVDLYQTDYNVLTTSSYGIKEILIHDDYDQDTADNDIAILVFNSALSKSDQDKVISVELVDNNECCTFDQELQAIGYGSNYFNGTEANELGYTNLEYVDKEECNSYLTEFIAEEAFNETFSEIIPNEIATSNMICAQSWDDNLCQTDGGGPLIKKGTNIQVGIVSFDYECDDLIPMVFTNVAVYDVWIRNVVKNTEQDLVDENPNDDDDDSADNDSNDALEEDEDQPFEKNEKIATISAVTGTAAVILFSVIGVILYCKFCSKRKQLNKGMQSLSDLDADEVEYGRTDNMTDLVRNTTDYNYDDCEELISDDCERHHIVTAK